MPFLASLLCLTSCHRRGFHVASALTPPDGTNASCEGMGPSSTSEPIWLRKHIRAGQRQSSERGRSGNETQVSAVALAAALVAWQVGLAVAQGGRRGRRRWRRRRWSRWRRSWRRKFGSRQFQHHGRNGSELDDRKNAKGIRRWKCWPRRKNYEHWQVE
jgi:hypothetical protein